MTQPRNYQTEAIIIKKMKLGEADRILTLYSQGYGKIRCVAKGVRRPRSKMSGHLELLTHSLVTLVRGRNLDTIIGTKTINSFFKLKNDLDLSMMALYATELCDQFTAERQLNRNLFQLLQQTLLSICEPGNQQLKLHYYELHLLSESGYRPQLVNCAVCHQPLKEVPSVFSLSAGGVICADCRNQSYSRELTVNTLKVLQLLQSNRYDLVQRLRINQKLASDIKDITRNYIRYILERDVKSAEFLDSLNLSK